jgi:hypothetical protein
MTGTGFIDYIDDSVTPATSVAGAFSIATTGITAEPLVVDVTRQKIYGFTSNPAGTNAVVVQGDTSLTATSKVTTPIGSGSNNFVLEGDFNPGQRFSFCRRDECLHRDRHHWVHPLSGYHQRVPDRGYHQQCDSQRYRRDRRDYRGQQQYDARGGFQRILHSPGVERHRQSHTGRASITRGGRDNPSGMARWA